MRYRAEVNREKCKTCESCVDNCTAKVLEIDEDGYPAAVRADDCQGCEICVSSCDYDAISVAKDERHQLSSKIESLFKKMIDEYENG